jgi:hypothetical protein
MNLLHGELIACTQRRPGRDRSRSRACDHRDGCNSGGAGGIYSNANEYNAVTNLVMELRFFLNVPLAQYSLSRIRVLQIKVETVICDYRAKH